MNQVKSSDLPILSPLLLFSGVWYSTMPPYRTPFSTPQLLLHILIECTLFDYRRPSIYALFFYALMNQLRDDGIQTLPGFAL